MRNWITAVVVVAVLFLAAVALFAVLFTSTQTWRGTDLAEDPHVGTWEDPGGRAVCFIYNDANPGTEFECVPQR